MYLVQRAQEKTVGYRVAHMHYWPSATSRLLDIGQLLLYVFYGPRRSPILPARLANQNRGFASWIQPYNKLFLLKTESLDNAILERAIIPCSPNMETVCVYSKFKRSWKSVDFTNKVVKNFDIFWALLIKKYSTRAWWIWDDYSSYATRTREIIVN